MIDQTLHGAQLSSTRDTSSIVADLRREHTCWKYVEGTHWHARFSHLVTYGAGMSLIKNYWIFACLNYKITSKH